MNLMAVTSKIAAWRYLQKIQSLTLSTRKMRELVDKVQHEQIKRKRKSTLRQISQKTIRQALCRRLSKQISRRKNTSNDLIR